VRLVIGGANANALSNNIVRDINVGPFPGCNGDVISGTANENFVFTSSSDASGGLHINFKHQINNMKLTGSPSGASYVGGFVETENDYISPAQVLSGVIMKTLNINLVGQGTTPNLRLQGFTSIVISANGVERVFTDTFTAVCH
jgi:hypothetical protein